MKLGAKIHKADVDQGRLGVAPRLWSSVLSASGSRRPKPGYGAFEIARLEQTVVESGMLVGRNDNKD